MSLVLCRPWGSHFGAKPPEPSPQCRCPWQCPRQGQQGGLVVLLQLQPTPSSWRDHARSLCWSPKQPRSSVLARAPSQSWCDNTRGQVCKTCLEFKVFCALSWQAEENCTTGSRNGSGTGDGTSHCEEEHWRGESLTSSGKKKKNPKCLFFNSEMWLEIQQLLLRWHSGKAC